MKTTIDIPEKAMNGLLKVTGMASKKAAVNMAIDSYIRQAKLRDLQALRGSVDDFMTQDDLQALRDD